MTGSTARADPLARVLEIGLAALVLGAPLPYGAVGAGGRTVLELAALALLAVWAVRACLRGTPLPSPLLIAGVLGLLGLALIQALPLGEGTVDALNPTSSAIRRAAVPPPDALAAERRLLGVDPAALDPVPTLSVAPQATASALRTGVALAALLLVATTVGAVRGGRGLALALLLGAAFQGLYGMLVLASGDPHLWNLPKLHYLGSATGSFVNRNHFACLLAMSLACGLGLIADNASRLRWKEDGKRLLQWFGSENSRNLLLGLLLGVGLAGLLLSYSRAGIALGLLALGLTLAGSGLFGRLRVRLVVALLVFAIATLPLLQIGSDRLLERFGRSSADLIAAGGRGAVWADTVRMARAFPLVGSGFGTFAVAYPLYRSPEVRLFYAHAHSDPLQAMAESGAVGSVLLLLVLVPVLGSIVRGLVGGFGVLGVGIAAGATAMVLHATIDFNFHIPANAATASVLAGLLQGLRWNATASG